MDKPNCYLCAYRQNLPRNMHSACINKDAQVTGNPHGIKNGWFNHPVNYDPIWVDSCTGFKHLIERKRKEDEIFST